MTKKDYTLAVNELRRHYNELSAHKKSVRAMVKAEFEAKIDFEIARRIEAEELKFANHLAAVKEREGLPVSIIQDHVLRTRTWSRWEKWRDMAGLEPEFVTAESVRQANKPVPFRIFQDEDGKWWITTFQFSEGKRFEEPFTLGIEVAVKESVKKGGALWVDTEWDRGEARTANYASMGVSLNTLVPYINAEVERALLAGEIPEIVGASEQFARDYNN